MSGISISVKKLATTPLPVLWDSVKKIRDLKAGSGITADQLSGVFLMDPALMLYVQKKVYTQSKSSLRPDIISMKQATMLMGFEKMQNIPENLPVLEEGLPTAIQMEYLKILARSYHAAHLASYWARSHKDLNIEEIYIAAFMHDVVEMLLWTVYPDKIMQINNSIRIDRVEPDEAQYIVLGNSLEHFSRELATLWNLPPFVQLCLRPEYTEEPRIQGVVLALQFVKALQSGWYNRRMHEIIDDIALYLKQDRDETALNIVQETVRVAHNSSLYKISPAAAFLPLLPEPESDKKADTESESMITVCITPRIEIVENTIRELEKSASQYSVNQIMRKVLHAMHDGLGLNRVVFCIVNTDRTKLQARYLVGTDNDARFNHFSINLEHMNLFTLLLKKNQSVWVNAENRQKYWQLVPKNIQDLIKTDAFLAMSLHVNQKPIGIFYADRHHPECALDKKTYTQFRRLCNIAVKGMSARSSA